jgi:hypothetical protein
VALVALHAVQTAAVDRYHSALHVNQIILAQLLSFPIKDCAIWRCDLANSSVETPHGLFHLSAERRVLIAFQ